MYCLAIYLRRINAPKIFDNELSTGSKYHRMMM